jgi:hypothetical protein
VPRVPTPLEVVLRAIDEREQNEAFITQSLKMLGIGLVVAVVLAAPCLVRIIVDWHVNELGYWIIGVFLFVHFLAGWIKLRSGLAGSDTTPRAVIEGILRESASAVTRIDGQAGNGGLSLTLESGERLVLKVSRARTLEVLEALGWLAPDATVLSPLRPPGRVSFLREPWVRNTAVLAVVTAAVMVGLVYVNHHDVRAELGLRASPSPNPSPTPTPRVLLELTAEPTNLPPALERVATGTTFAFETSAGACRYEVVSIDSGVPASVFRRGPQFGGADLSFPCALPVGRDFYAGEAIIGLPEEGTVVQDGEETLVVSGVRYACARRRLVSARGSWRIWISPTYPYFLKVEQEEVAGPRTMLALIEIAGPR